MKHKYVSEQSLSLVCPIYRCVLLVELSALSICGVQTEALLSVGVALCALSLARSLSLCFSVQERNLQVWPCAAPPCKMQAIVDGSLVRKAIHLSEDICRVYREGVPTIAAVSFRRPWPVARIVHDGNVHSSDSGAISAVLASPNNLGKSRSWRL